MNEHDGDLPTRRRVVGNTSHDAIMAAMIERVDAMREDQRRTEVIQEKITDTLDHLRDTVGGLDTTVKLVNQRLDRQDKLGDAVEGVDRRVAKMELVLDPDTFRARYARFERIETLVLRWEGWIGKGWSFVGKVLLTLVGSGAAGAAIIKMVTAVLH